MTTISVRTIRSGFLACAFAMAAMASTSQAIAQSPQMTVKVPFPFHNGSQILPAGEYTVSMNSEHVLLVRGLSDGGFAMTTPEEAGRRPRTARLHSGSMATGTFCTRSGLLAAIPALSA